MTRYHENCKSCTCRDPEGESAPPPTTADAKAGATAVRRWTINRVREDDGLVGMYEASSARFRDGEKFVHVETKFVLASDHDAAVAALEARLAERNAAVAWHVEQEAMARLALAQAEARVARFEQLVRDFAEYSGGMEYDTWAHFVRRAKALLSPEGGAKGDV